MRASEFMIEAKLYEDSSLDANQATKKADATNTVEDHLAAARLHWKALSLAFTKSMQDLHRRLYMHHITKSGIENENV